MGIFSLILIVLWIAIIFEGIYGLAKGHFPKEQNKVEKHDPAPYKKWVKISSVVLILCSVVNIILSILDSFSEAEDWKFVGLIVLAVILTIVIMSISYRKIVIPADRKAGIEGEFKKILEENSKK